jgi:hypothetical protein
MAVIINELEVVLEPPKSPPAGGGQAAPEKPTLNPQDLLSVLDREQRSELRLCAH